MLLKTFALALLNIVECGKIFKSLLFGKIDLL